jgi:hypothetical protein
MELTSANHRNELGKGFQYPDENVAGQHFDFSPVRSDAGNPVEPSWT